MGSRVRFQSERDVSTVGPFAGWATGQPRDFEHGSPECLLDGLMKCIVPVHLSTPSSKYHHRLDSTTPLFPLTFISATTNDNVDRLQYPRSARRQVEAQEGPLTVGRHLLAQTQDSNLGKQRKYRLVLGYRGVRRSSNHGRWPPCILYSYSRLEVV